jgi:hypothetical protein
MTQQFFGTRTHAYALRITSTMPPIGATLPFAWERDCARAMLMTGLPVEILLQLSRGEQAIRRIDVSLAPSQTRTDACAEALAAIQTRLTACAGEEWFRLECVSLGRQAHRVLVLFCLVFLLATAGSIAHSDLYPAYFYEEAEGTALFLPYATVTYGEWAEKRDTTLYICTFRTADGRTIADTSRVTDVPPVHGAAQFLYSPSELHTYVIGSRKEKLARTPEILALLLGGAVVVVLWSVLPRVRFWWVRRGWMRRGREP